MKLINVALALALLLNGFNREVFASVNSQYMDKGIVSKRDTARKLPAQNDLKNFVSACDDYVNGEIIVKMKASLPTNSNNRVKFSTLGTGSTVNSQDSSAVESYLERNIPALGNINIDKAIKSSIDTTSSLSLSNFTATSKNRVVQSPAKTKLQLKAENLEKKYGFDRVYKIHTNQNDCTSLERLIKQIDADANVEYAEANRKVKVNNVNINDPLYLSQGEVWGLGYDELWGLKQIKADQAWDISRGTNVVVAVIDTGVDYDHPDLWDNIWVDPNLVFDRNQDGKINLDDADLDGDKKITGDEIIPGMFGYDFAYDDNDPRDFQGHGTHVSGTIAAVANNAKGIVGIAPNAKILMLKGLDDTGFGTYQALASAVKRSGDMLATNSHINSLVTNNSWGGYGYSQTIADAFEYAKELGVINVVAAGNATDDAINYSPASLPSVITVAASRVDSGLAGFSNYGLSVDVAAPGGGDASDFDKSNILSTMNTNSEIASFSTELVVQTDAERGDFAYVRIAGTSMASPHIAGVAALIKSLHPDYDLEDIRSLLRNNVDPIYSNKIETNKIETGIVNAFAAVNLDRVPPKAFLHPVREPLSGKINLNGTASSVGFNNYILEYATQDAANENQWTAIGTFHTAVDAGLLLQDFDTFALPEGELLIRLTVYDSNGSMAQDLIKVNVDNIELIYPLDDQLNFEDLLAGRLLTSFETTTVGKLLLPIIIRSSQALSNLEIRIVDDQGIAVDANLIEYTGDESVVAHIDTSKLTHAGYYTVQLFISDNLLESTGFVYEPKLAVVEPFKLTDDSYDLLYEHFTVNDFNNDGITDILVGQASNIKVVHANGGDLLAHNFPQSAIYRSPLIADLYGNGNKLLINPILDFHEHIYRVKVVDKNSNELNNWELALVPNSLHLETMISDVNYDKKPDILALSTIRNGNGFVFVHLSTAFLGTDNLVHKEHRLLTSFQGSALDSIVVDLDADGKDELVLLTTGDKLYESAIRIFSLEGNLLRTIPVNLYGNYDASLSAADIDGDDDFEIVTVDYAEDASSDGSKIIVNVFNHDGSILSGWPFTTTVGNWLSINDVVIGDLNNDGLPEIVFAAYRAEYNRSIDDYEHIDYIFALNKDGQPLANYPLVRHLAFDQLTDLANSAPSSIVIADVDNNGKADIVVAMEPDKDTREVIFAYQADGSMVRGFPLHAANATPRFYGNVPNSMALGNFDNDAGMELVFADVLKYVYVYDLDVSATAKVEWGMYRADVENSGVYGKKRKPRLKADLSIAIVADKTTVNTGDIVTLELQARNNANAATGSVNPAYGVVATMDIPADLSPVTINENCSIRDNKMTCNFYTVASGAIKRFPCQFRATNNEFKNIEIPVGAASVTATSLVPSHRSVDPNLTNNISNIVRVLVNQRKVDLSSKISIDKSKVLPGDLVTLEVQAINNTNVVQRGWIADAYGVKTTMQLPAGLTPVTLDSNCYIENNVFGNVLTCNFSTVKSGARKRLFNTFRTNNVMQDTSILIDGAFVRATSEVLNQISIDPNSSNDLSNSINLLVAPRRADLSISRITTNKTTYLKGEEVAVTVVANNNVGLGNYDAYGVVLKIPQPSFLTFDPLRQDPNQFCELINGEIVCQLFTILVGASKSRTIKFFIPANSTVGTRDITIGSATVIAGSTIANQFTLDPNANNNTLYTNISTAQYADLSMDIKANKTSYKYNENISLTFTVFNRADASKSYVSDAYAVMSRMALPANYDYAGDNSYCTVDTNRILTCNFYTLKSTVSKFQVVTLKPAATAKAGARTLSLSATNSSEATVLTQKTIDPVIINDTKSINVTVQ